MSLLSGRDFLRKGASARVGCNVTLNT